MRLRIDALFIAILITTLVACADKGAHAKAGKGGPGPSKSAAVAGLKLPMVGITLNTSALVATPLGVVMLIVPDVTPSGTVVVTVVSETTMKGAAVWS